LLTFKLLDVRDVIVSALDVVAGSQFGNEIGVVKVLAALYEHSDSL
jgi:hypothetical protein